MHCEGNFEALLPLFRSLSMDTRKVLLAFRLPRTPNNLFPALCQTLMKKRAYEINAPFQLAGKEFEGMAGQSGISAKRRI